MSKKMSPQQVKLLLFCLGIFLSLAGLSVARDAWRGLKDVPNWIPVDALVLSSRVDESRSIHIGGGSRSTAITYSPLITYKYSYEGKDYTYNRYTLTGSVGEEYDPRKVVNQYPAGTNTTAYVNPDNPQEAVLNMGDRGSKIVLGALGFIFALIGIGILGAAIFLTLRKEEQV